MDAQSDITKLIAEQRRVDRLHLERGRSMEEDTFRKVYLEGKLRAERRKSESHVQQLKLQQEQELQKELLYIMDPVLLCTEFS